MVTVGPAAGQFSHFTVDLTGFYQAWTQNAAFTTAAIVFVTINESSAAALPVPNQVPDPTLCLAHYANFVLDVQSL
jgi:hypothetical protein